MGRRIVLWSVLCQGVLLGRTAAAAAQDIDGLIATGDKHLAAYEYDQALAQYTSIPEHATPDQLLEKYSGIAMSLMGVSRYTEVGAHVDRVMALAEQIGSDSAMARAENIRGQFLSGTKTGDHGLDSFLRAADLAERAGNRAALSAIYGNLATAYQTFEDWGRQAYYIQKRYELLPAPTAGQRFNFHIGRGIALFELYERDEAERAFTTALELSAETKRPRDRSFALGELGFLYWTFDRDLNRALPHYEEALQLARVAKVGSLEANWHGLRGNLYRDTGDYARALDDYRRAIAILETGGMSTQTFHLYKNIGQVVRLKGDTRTAEALLAQLVKERWNDASPRLQWQALMELASAQASNGNRAAARASFERMIDVLERQRKGTILEAYRTGSFAHALSAYDPYERYIKFLIDEGQHVEALHVAERARARGFLEALASVRGAVAQRLPKELLAEEARVNRAISAAQEKLRSPSLTKVSRDAVLAELATAEQARDNFLLAMRIEHPAIAEARYPSLLAPRELQRSLRTGETAVAFFLSEPRSLRWIVTPEAIRFDTIAARTAIEREAGELRGLLSAPSAGTAARDAAGRLSTLLFDGAAFSGRHPIVIVAHGVLHYIPFEVLPLDGRPMIASHAVSYMPSLNSLSQLRQQPRQPAPMRVLAIGDPAVDAAPAPTRGGGVENVALLGALPYADRELFAINRAIPDRTLVIDGPAARESRLRQEALDRFPIVHFATHGLVSDVQPSRSGLLLSKEDGEDGLLQMSEIYAMRLRADLVVLSACQTALGRDVTGEGIIGLTRAFFYAGARSVVSALWNLNDRFASEFVERFYTEIGQGHSPEEALRATKASFIDHPRYSHPFYWASLVLTGDGSQPIVARPIRRPVLQPLVALALAAAALLVVVMEFRR
ncbi:MAG TPA: CHAT domain-containing protein [Vicinamibacterales bacterium]|nr:CHAT domain-containing protein [Vicinamibacterales bacterium]